MSHDQDDRRRPAPTPAATRLPRGVLMSNGGTRTSLMRSAAPHHLHKPEVQGLRQVHRPGPASFGGGSPAAPVTPQLVSRDAGADPKAAPTAVDRGVDLRPASVTPTIPLLGRRHKAARRRYAGNEPDRCDPDRLIDERAAAEMLGISPDTLRNQRCRGDGPRFVRLSARCIRFEVAEILKYIAERRVKSTSYGGSDA